MEPTRAVFEEEWFDLTKEHQRVREQAELQISAYLVKRKGVNPVAIWGPFGQGKTQLLYHLFKFIWQHGGQALFMPLEALVPDQRMGGTDYAEFVKKCVARRLDALLAGDLPKAFPSAAMREFVGQFAQDASARPTVLLIDEMEAYYQRLTDMVWTDDRSPMRDYLEKVITGDAEHYVISAFAPMSYYESVVGEAERSTWCPLRLPLLTPAAARSKSASLGNLAWWMSRGRVRALNRSMSLLSQGQVSPSSPIVNWDDLCKDLGETGGVPPIDCATLAKSFPSSAHRQLLFPLGPQTQDQTSGLATTGPRVHKDALRDTLAQALIEDGLAPMTSHLLARYASVALDGVANGAGFVVCSEADFQDVGFLLKLAVDLLIEWESDESSSAREASAHVEALLADQNRLVTFFFNKLRPRLLQANTDDGQQTALRFALLYELFPMPVVSPQFGGMSPSEAQLILNNAPTTSLAQASVPGKPDLVFRFFPGYHKLAKFLSDRDAILPYLRPPMSLVCVPLHGQGERPDIAGLAAWLDQEKRLATVLPRQLLGDFLTCALAWGIKQSVIKGTSTDLLHFLREDAPGACGSDKAMTRRLHRYTNMAEELLATFPVGPKQEPMALKHSKQGVIDLRGRSQVFADAVGFAFVDGQADVEFMYELRTATIGSTISELRTGVTAVFERASSVKQGSRAPTHAALLQSVKEDLAPYLSSLRMLAALVDELTFTRLASDENVGTVLSGLHRYCTVCSALTDNCIARLKATRTDVDRVVGRAEQIKKEREEFTLRTEVNVACASSENVLPALAKLRDLCDAACSGNLGNYTRHLTAVLVNTLLAGVVESLLGPDETAAGELRQLSRHGERYLAAIRRAKTIGQMTYQWLGLHAGAFVDPSQKAYAEAVRNIMGYQSDVKMSDVPKLDWQRLDELISGIEQEVDTLTQIQGHLQSAVALAESANAGLTGEVSSV